MNQSAALRPLPRPHAPPVPDAGDVPHNVPAALSSFVGRARELGALAEALGGARLVTVTGPGGTGKTRIAREAAAALASGATAAGATVADGVWWVELAPVADAGAVAAAVAAALDVALPAGADAAAALATAVGGAAALLVLDNCEHVIDAAAALADALLRACPRLTVLATSREALAVEGEHAWVLPPLGLPPRSDAPGSHTPLTAASAAAFDAVRLFVERARAASPAFALTDANAAAVAAVCARLDGLPLALELAAAQVPAFGVESLAARLADALGVLTRSRRAAPARHQTLRALLDWSWARLADAERGVLGRLSVFRGAFTLDAAAAVAADGPGDRPSAMVALGRLVEQSLVDVRDAGGAVRYALLETVRQYAAERLGDDPAGAAEVADRHLAWAADVEADAAPRLWSAEWFAESSRLALLADDLRAAVLWGARATDPSRAGRRRAERALAVLGALYHRWVVAGDYDDALRTTAAALAGAVAAGLVVEDPPGCWTAAPDAGLDVHHALGGALECWMVLTMHLHRPHDTLRAADGAIATAAAEWDVAAAVSAPPTLARQRRRWYAMMLAAEARLHLGDVEGAIRPGPEIVTAARASGDQRGVAGALTRVGFYLAVAGRHAEATAMLDEASAGWRAQGDSVFLTLTEQSLGDLAYAAGYLPRAAASVRTTVAIQRDTWAPWNLIRTLGLAAGVLAAATVRAGGESASPADAADVARLLGAADQLRRRGGILLQPYDRPLHDRSAAAADAVLGPDDARAAWTEGARLDPQAAMDLALAAAERAAPVHAVGDPVETRDGVSARDPTPAGDPPASPPPAPVLHVTALRLFGLTRGGASTPAAELPAGKVRELLLYLALHPEGCTKEQIGLALWPDASAAQVRSNFHFTLHHLRRALAGSGAAGAAPEWVAYAGGRYQLARELTSDVADLREAAARLRRAEQAREALDEAALDDAERAFDAARGAFGEDVPSGAWVSAYEDAARTAWGDGMHALARQHARAGRRARAAALLRRLVARDSLREAAHRELMVLWAADGEQPRALAHYDAHAAQLAREFGAAPDRETRALAERLRTIG